MMRQSKDHLGDVQLDKPFHARIFRNYIDYVQAEVGWSAAQVNEFLAGMGTSFDRLFDDSTWYDLDFTNRFYEELVKATGDERLAYHSGRYLPKQIKNSTFHFFLKGVVTSSGIYNMLPRLSSYYNKVVNLKTIRSSNGFALVESYPPTKIQEQPYMCENRIGMFESVPEIFGLPPAEIHHSKCFHRGDSICSYEVRWANESEFKPYALTAGIVALASLMLGWFYGLKLAGIGLGVGLVVLIGTYLVRSLIRLRGDLENQTTSLANTLSDLDSKNLKLEFVHQMAKLTNSMLDPKELANIMVQKVCEVLNYDRAMILKVMPRQSILKMEAFWGFEGELQEAIKDIEFKIDPSNESGFFIRVINSNESLFLKDVEAEMEKLSPRSQALVKRLKSRSFIAVPLRDEAGDPTGVLAVDYTRPSGRLSLADQDLLMTLSQYLGVALLNAGLVKKLESSLMKTKQYVAQQERMTRVFQKFVPKGPASEIIRATTAIETDLHLVGKAKKEDVGIMFCDIFGFTKIANELPAEDVSILLNTFFEIANPVIEACDGFIDKFTGDGFLAIFTGRSHGENACLAATQLIQKMPQVNRDLAAKNFSSIEIGIGAAAGKVIIGHLGTEDRLNYTVIGRVVNLAQRFETQTRQLGANTVCVSARLRSLASKRFHFKDLGALECKGFDELQHAFELLVPSSKENISGESDEHAIVRKS